MNNTGLDDTIVALATAPGQSALALVRISGLNARELILRLAPELHDCGLIARRATLTRIIHPLSGDNLDRAIVTWFVGPNSYTGEDAVEISTHGGSLVPGLTVEAAIAGGARPALPGEFTRRALLNGKLDLLEAEAVLDMIEGSSPALHRAAIHQMEGGLSTRVDGVRRRLIELSAALAYGIDFPDEDEPPIPPERILAQAVGALEELDLLLRTAPHGELLRQGALVVLSGRPNSGKSSLFNALCGRERALVTEIAGTTRDAIEVLISVLGFPFRLVDTAGLRESDDVIESLGIEVARKYVAGADLVLLCAESGRGLDEAEVAFLASLPSKVIVVRTKADLGDATAGGPDEIQVSARTGDGLDSLRERMHTLSFGSAPLPGDEPIVTRQRHTRALGSAREELENFTALLRDGAPSEVAATHLEAALEQLEELLGRIDQEDVLDAVFSTFCVGK